METNTGYLTPETFRHYSKEVIGKHVAKHGLPETTHDSHIILFDSLVSQYLECVRQMWEARDKPIVEGQTDWENYSKFEQCWNDRSHIADEIYQLLKDMGINVPQHRHDIFGDIDELWARAYRTRTNVFNDINCAVNRGY